MNHHTVIKELGQICGKHIDKFDQDNVIAAIVQNNQLLESACGNKVDYFASGENSPQAAGLEPNHTQFLLVDKRQEDVRQGELPWGAENELEEALLRQIREEFKAPTVLLLVQGGAGSLDTMMRSMRQDIVTVVCADSGKIATALATYMDMDHGHGGTKDLDDIEEQ